MAQQLHSNGHNIRIHLGFLETALKKLHANPDIGKNFPRFSKHDGKVVSNLDVMPLRVVRTSLKGSDANEVDCDITRSI